VRKTIVVVLSILLMATLVETASAWTLRVRHDPRETSTRWDIRRVSSDLTTRRMFLEVGTWRKWEKTGFFVYRLDTNGSYEVDRTIQVVPARHRVLCIVRLGGGHLVGVRPGRRANPSSIACVIPRVWFTRIHRAVRFSVAAYSPHAKKTDVAPDQGRYRWV
jgi:hypothetical protein